MKVSVVVLAGVFVLAGCAGVPAPTVTPIAEPSETPAPTTAPTYGPPDPVMGGDCANVVTVADVETAYGQSPVNGIEQSAVLDYPELSTLGGIVCGWTLPDGSGSDLRIAPAAAVDPAPPIPMTCHRDFSSTCEFEAIVSGYWIGGMSGVLDESYAASIEAGAQAIVNRISPKLLAAGPPAAPATFPPAWLTHECGSLSTDAGIPGVLEAPDVTVGVDETDVYYVQERIRSFVGATNCTWDGSAPFLFFTAELIPGAAWILDVAATEPVSYPAIVDGAAAAVWGPPFAGYSEATNIYATDGVNLLILETSTSDPDEATMSAVAAALLAAAP